MENPPSKCFNLAPNRHSLFYWELTSFDRITFFAKLIYPCLHSINDSGEKGGQENV